MSYTKTVFGKMDDGTEVYRYTLKNSSGASASFTDMGAVWLTMEVPDKDGKLADVVLAVDTVEALKQNPGHMGEIVGRNANRIGDAKFTLNGKTYQLAANDGKNNLHSGPDYYRLRKWDADVEETSLGTMIVFSLFSPDGDQGYPGNAEIMVSYTLTEDNALQIDYHATCDEDTVVNMTNHAYFNLAGHDSGIATDQLIWIDADHYTVTDDGSIPTGEIAPVEGTPLDFRTAKATTGEIDTDFHQVALCGGYDNNFVLNHEPGELSLAAKAYDPKSGRYMEVYTDLPGLQLYAGNSLSTKLGKNGTTYHDRDGYCFESQYFPNNLNCPNFASSVLKAGDEYKTTTIYQFGVE